MTREAKTNTYKTTARIVGASFLTATTMYILGENLLGDILSAPDYLLEIHANSSQLITGVLLTFVTAAANVLIGVMLFPILKQYSERIALGYALTRFFDGAGILVAGIGTLSLLTLSREYVQAGAPDASRFQELGALIIAQSGLSFDITMIVLGLGAMPFCYLLYRTRLIPRWIAALGFIGYAALFAGGLVELFGPDLHMIQYLPGGIFEVVLPIWLIVKGFNISATTSESAKTLVSGRERKTLSKA